MKNVLAAEDTRTASHLVSPDALALVRFGLLAAGDPHITDTVKVIDALLKVDTPSGDSADIPEHELRFGRPSGSAMPLVWAHAEYLKLRRSLHDGRVFDLPPQTVARYLEDKRVSPRLVWRFNHKIQTIPPGKLLRIETLSPAVIHWSGDDWKTTSDVTAEDPGLGIYVADLPTRDLTEGSQVRFTLYWPDAHQWQGADFAVLVCQFRCESGADAGKD